VSCAGMMASTSGSTSACVASLRSSASSGGSTCGEAPSGLRTIPNAHVAHSLQLRQWRVRRLRAPASSPVKTQLNAQMGGPPLGAPLSSSGGTLTHHHHH